MVLRNYTNNGTIGDFSVNYQRDFTPNDRITLVARHELSRYLLPNEMCNRPGAILPGNYHRPALPAANANNFETMGTASYQHIFSTEYDRRFSRHGAQ